jgi:formate hydrogenlyase subunit 3/multisubunit Na+/H+ antiporter MnhD subunit
MVMPNIILIIATGLGAAFLLGFLRDEKRLSAYLITLAALAFMSLISGLWLIAFAGGAAPVEVTTAGTPAPFAINFKMGLAEAALLLLINLTALLSAIYMQQTMLRLGRRIMAVFLIAVMAVSGIILTRDVFNLFVFLELVVIASGGLVLMSTDKRALGAGFKYLMVSEFITVFLLIGIIFAYHASGSLNIDTMAASDMLAKQGGALAFFLILIALIAELKPFPANGWALDIYESAHPGFSALFSAVFATGALFAVDKVLLMGGTTWLPLATGIGLLTFVASNIMGLAQHNDRRLLGYSSIAQVGLVLAIIGQREVLGDSYLFIAGGILLAHAVAKAGLFWMSGMVEGRDLKDWTVLRQKPLMVGIFITFIAMLTGLPPFPGFYAKWELVHGLIAHNHFWLVGVILFGALIEVTYLMRWFGYVIKRDEPRYVEDTPFHKELVVVLAAAAGWVLAYVWGEMSAYRNLLSLAGDNLLVVLPLMFALLFFVIDGLPARIKNIIAIAGMVAYFVASYSSYDPLQLIFGSIILLGGAVIMLASFHAEGRRGGFYPSAMLMYAGLALLIIAENSFAFFAAWEMLTIGSYFLILRGKASEPHALSYIIFSLGGAFAILTGFALAAHGQAPFEITSLADVREDVAPYVFILLAVGFMTKTAAIGLHIWLPGAHAEAETDVSPMVSGVLLKAGLFGLFTLLMTMGRQHLGPVDLTLVLLWIGALTALLGNMMATFQEDAKRLLAYSSIGQMGYALFGLALMNKLGWLMALLFVINHYIYKSMLFLSVGGVAKRTGTRAMYKMGGLIALMPLSFIAVMIGIIAMSGVPPLSGYGGRWIFYNAIMSAEHRLPMILIFLSGPIGFLYLFRLVHTIFLGQLKDEHRRLKEAPFWIILPQMIYVVFLLGFAVVPGLALRRVDAYLTRFFPNEFGLDWTGPAITSEYGYWAPVSIMIVIGVIFCLVLGWMLFLNRNAQKVKQFNIVYSAERPYRPETTHYAWNFYAPYRKALGFMVQPFVTNFWNGIATALHNLGDFSRRIYTGNGQTYAFQMLIFVVMAYLVSRGMI